jgi:hypothetical protein
MTTITPTFGTTRCEITVHGQVTPGSSEPAYTATGSIAGQPVRGRDGGPLELTAGTEEGALRRMFRALEQRFGSVVSG